MNPIKESTIFMNHFDIKEPKTLAIFDHKGWLISSYGQQKQNTSNKQTKQTNKQKSIKLKGFHQSSKVVNSSNQMTKFIQPND
jgi:hypothetical protein